MAVISPPTWFRELFSDGKLPSHRVLNYLGGQVFRTVVARAIYRARGGPVPSGPVGPPEILGRDGVLVWPGFLPAHNFERLAAEFLATLDGRPGDFHVSVHSAWARSVNVDQLGPELLPETYAFLRDPRLHALIERVERRPWDAVFKRCNLQVVIQGKDPAEDDQTDLHSDTFFHTHKAWLYLTDVGPEDGCLSVVKTSHHLTARSLWATYRHSLAPQGEASRRVSARELARAGLVETPIVCRRNTLVVANVHAIHRRMPGRPGRARLAVHLSARANPFQVLVDR